MDTIDEAEQAWREYKNNSSFFFFFFFFLLSFCRPAVWSSSGNARARLAANFCVANRADDFFGRGKDIAILIVASTGTDECGVAAIN